MSDLLVSLYNLPTLDAGRVDKNIDIRRALAPERQLICDWVKSVFGQGWSSEVAVAFSGLPITTWVAVKGGELIGFACFDATARGFFGPTGVAEAFQGQGAGRGLLLSTLQGMREAGYGYAIIGGAGGQQEYYSKILDIYAIPNSIPGVYRGLLKPIS